MTRRLAALLIAVLTAASCSAGDDGTTLTARFDHVRNLTSGHAVLLADVRVGTVTAIELDGHTPVVTLAIEPDRRIPVGTTATISKVSLLGENYVGLDYPDDPGGPFLEDGAVIGSTSVRPEVESVVGQAIDVVGGLAVRAVDAIVDALADGFGGRGEQTRRMLQRFATVADVYARHSDDIAATVDGLGRLGTDLEAGADDIGRFVDEMAETSATVARQRERMVGTLREMTRAATTLEDALLTPHGEQLTQTLARLRPVVEALAANRDSLDRLVSSLLLFVTTVDDAIVDDELQIYNKVTFPEGRS